MSQTPLEIMTSQPVLVRIDGTEYRLQPPSIAALMKAGIDLDGKITGDALFGVLHLAFKSHHPNVTREWIEGIFDTRNTDQMQAMLGELFPNGQPGE